MNGREGGEGVTSHRVQLSVFTKPWRNLTVPELGRRISMLGFDGIEFPLRTGYQVEPGDAEKGLPKLADQLAEFGLKLFSITGEPAEHVFAGCQEAGIPVIRIMPEIRGESYLASLERVRGRLEGIVPLCEKYGVRIGVQQHYGNYIVDSASMLRLVEGFDPAHIGVIWDAAHDALAGQQPEYGLDTVWSHLCMVNLKNAYYFRTNGPEAEQAEWKRYFTSGKQGLASWPRIADYLKKRGYSGAVCLTAEYTAGNDAERLIAEDLAFARSLF